MMRRFVLVRDEDVTGVSGTGKVAEGVLWSDSTVTVKWLGQRTSEVSWPGGVNDVNAVHGHNGATRVVWIDEDYVLQHPIAVGVAELDRRDHPEDYREHKDVDDATDCPYDCTGHHTCAAERVGGGNPVVSEG